MLTSREIANSRTIFLPSLEYEPPNARELVRPAGQISFIPLSSRRKWVLGVFGFLSKALVDTAVAIRAFYLSGSMAPGTRFLNICFGVTGTKAVVAQIVLAGYRNRPFAVAFRAGDGSAAATKAASTILNPFGVHLNRVRARQFAKIRD